MYFGCKVTKKRTKHKGESFLFLGAFEIFMPYLCIDLRTILRSDRKAKTHKDYPGVLTRDGREHFHDYAFNVYRELLGALKGLVGRM